MNPKYQVESLDKRKHDRETFSCGVIELDTYLREQANKDMVGNVSKAYVLSEFGSNYIAGYYTLSSSTIKSTELPPELIKQLRLRRYPNYPAVLLGRLAVSTSHQGQGIGKRLLYHALQRSLKVSGEIGVIAVTVDSKGDDSRSFYERFRFIRYVDKPYSLFFTMREIELLFPPPVVAPDAA